jgi:hypothetical protein
VILQFTYATLESLLIEIRSDHTHVKYLQSMISEHITFYLDVYENKIDEKEGIEKERKRVEVFSFIVTTLLMLNGDDDLSKKPYELFNILENQRIVSFFNQMI